MHARIVKLALLAAVGSLAGASGAAAHAVRDGSWYGKIVKVDVVRRKLIFAPACRLSSGRWIAVPATRRVPSALAVVPRADLEIYFRPDGNPAAGHAQPVSLEQLADIVRQGRVPAFPPGWFVTVRDRAAVSVVEDSGVRSVGKADRRTFACVWSRSTQTFVIG